MDKYTNDPTNTYWISKEQCPCKRFKLVRSVVSPAVRT